MASFAFDLLTEEEIDKITGGAFRVMEEIGMDIHHEEARAMLAAAGAAVQGIRVRIPRDLTQTLLAKIPASLTIYHRDGEPAMELGGRNSYFGPGVTCPWFLDPLTGQRRPSVKNDVTAVATVADGLEHMDFLMSLCMISDVTPTLADVHEIHAMLKIGRKPIAGWAFNLENLKAIAQMAFTVAGGPEAFAEKPFLILYAEPTTPLVHSKEALDKVIFLAKNNIPCVYSPGMTLGGTAPVTLAGALTIGLADVFTGAVISQLTNPGAGLILSSNGGVLDMKTLQGAYGSPEMCLIDAAGTQILRSLGIPSFGLAGATDAKRLDAQSAMEATAEILMSLGSGANLIHDAGMSDVGMTGSVELMVFCDEAIAYAKRLRQGFATDEESLAFQAIASAGPGGNFIESRHTYRNFRRELYDPKLGLREQYDLWNKKGGKTMADRGREKMCHLLEKHKPVQPDPNVLARLDQILAEAERLIFASDPPP
jgi:trimethylamine--corrinoid protein Co-methyltransferase